MISAGIVVEYNPFHNGHAYHLKRTREITEADVVIAVMSGYFLQRGEPALVDKFSRTKMALKAGVDLVIELPYAFCTQKAEIFAKGAVELLSHLMCDYLCFGSEEGNIDAFEKTYVFLKHNKKSYHSFIRQYMDEGVSYPKACSLAFNKLAPDKKLLDLSKPNNILGYQYVESIKELNCPMKPLTIQRIGASYHDESLSGNHISSATGIRHHLFQTGNMEGIKPYIPSSTYAELSSFKNKYKTFVQWENFWPFLKYKILQSEPAELKEIYEMEEGLENRLIRAIKDAGSFNEFMAKIKTKRYTWTRLQRGCVHILTNTKKPEMHERSQKIEYVRILGFNNKGRKYLKHYKDAFQIPIVSNLSQFDKTIIRPDVRAGQMYSFAFPSSIGQQIIQQEFKQPPIIMNADD